MKNILKRIHLSAALALIGNVVGLTDLIAQNPKVASEVVIPHLGLSPEWATAVVLICTTVQAVTRAVHKGDVQEVPKPRYP